jgi:hypothetical protein
MNSLRLDPGSRVGYLLQEVAEAVANGQISTREEALELVRNKMNKRDTRA